VFLTVKKAKIRKYGISKILGTVKFQDLVKYFVGSWCAEIKFILETIVKGFLENTFLERLLWTSKSFWALEISYPKKILGWNFWKKIPHGFKPCEIGKGMLLTHRLYFLVAQAFPFLDQKYSTWFYLRKNSQMFWSSVFENNQECELHLSKKNRAFVSVLKSFQYWHTWTSFTLQ